jgi:hypothetical protein
MRVLIGCSGLFVLLLVVVTALLFACGPSLVGRTVGERLVEQVIPRDADTLLLLTPQLEEANRTHRTIACTRTDGGTINEDPNAIVAALEYAPGDWRERNRGMSAGVPYVMFYDATSGPTEVWSFGLTEVTITGASVTCLQSLTLSPE